MKQKAKTSLFLLLIVFFWIPVIYMSCSDLPRGNDLEASKTVYDEFFESAKTNVLMGRTVLAAQFDSNDVLNAVSILPSPRRNFTRIQIQGQLSWQETESLTSPSEKIGLEYQRKIVLKFIR